MSDSNNFTNTINLSQPQAINTDPFINPIITGGPSESVQRVDAAINNPLPKVEIPSLTQSLIGMASDIWQPVGNIGSLSFGPGGGKNSLLASLDPNNIGDNRMQSTKFDIDQKDVYSDLTSKTWEDWMGFGKVAKYENYIKGTDNEDRLAKEQSNWQMWGRGIEKGLQTASSMVLNTVGMIAYGIPKAIQQKSMSALVDNEFARFIDDFNTTYQHEDMIYKSQEYRNASALGQFAYGTHWADTILQGAGYLLGGIAVGGAAGAGLKSVGLGANMMGGASRAALGNITKSALTGDFASLGAKAVASAMKKAVWADVRKATVKSALNNAVTLITSAAPEAQMEALQFAKEDEAQYVSAFKNTYQRPPTASELEEYKGKSQSVMNGVFAANLALVGASNFLQFGDLLGAEKIFKKGLLDSVINRTFGLGVEKSVFAAGKEGLESAAYNAIKRSIGQKVGYRVFTALESPVTEGLWEEGMQSVVQNTASDYMQSKFNPQASDKNRSILESFGNGFIETYGTKEGWSEILAGMVIGAGGSFRWNGGRPDILGQREASHTINQAQIDADNLNKTQSQFINAHEKLLNAQNNYNELANDSIIKLNDRIGNANQQIANSDRARKEAAKGNLEQAKLYYTNAVFAKLMAEERAGLSESNKFDMDNMIDNIPENVMRDMYGFESKEDMDVFKERTKKTLENQREAFKVANEFAEQLNLGATDPMSSQNLKEASALNFFHGMMAADTANDIARALEDTVGIGGIADSMHYYANLEKTNQEKLQKLQENKNTVAELEKRRTELLNKYTLQSERAASQPESEARQKDLDATQALLDGINTEIENLTEESGRLESVLSERANTPSLPFGNPASKFFSGINLNVADGDVRGVIDSLKQYEDYINHLNDATGKTEEQVKSDRNKAKVLMGLTQSYKNQMKLMRNFAKTANMVSDPSYGNTLYKKAKRKKETKFDNSQWIDNDKAGMDVNNEGKLNPKMEQLKEQLQDMVDKGKISKFDMHTWQVNAEIMAMHGRVWGDNKISLTEMAAVVTVGEGGESSFDAESELGKEILDGIVSDILNGNPLSENQAFIFNMNTEQIAQMVEDEKASKETTLDEVTNPEKNKKLAQQQRFERIRDKKIADVERRRAEFIDRVYNDGTIDLSKLRYADEALPTEKREVVKADTLKVGDRVDFMGEVREIESIESDLYGVKKIVFKDGKVKLLNTLTNTVPFNFVKVTEINTTQNVGGTENKVTTKVVNEGLDPNTPIEQHPDIVEAEFNREIEEINKQYEEALNPTEKETKDITSVLEELNTTIDNIVSTIHKAYKDLHEEIVNDFSDDTIPTKKDFNRATELLNKGVRTDIEQAELDDLLSKINDFGLVEGRISVRVAGNLRLSDLLEQRAQLENELFSSVKALTPLNLDEMRMTFESQNDTFEKEAKFKEAQKTGDAAVLNSYDFATFADIKGLGEYQVSNLTPQGFIQTVAPEFDSLTVIGEDGNQRVIDTSKEEWDGDLLPGDKVTIDFSNEDGNHTVNFSIDKSRRVNIPYESAETVSKVSPLNFNTKNQIGNSKYYTLTQTVNGVETYASSDFNIELDSNASQRLNPGDPIYFEYDTEAPYNKKLESEHNLRRPDENSPELIKVKQTEELIEQIRDNNATITGQKAKDAANKPLFDRLKLLYPEVTKNKIREFNKAKTKLRKEYNDRFKGKISDNSKREFKDSMVIVAKDKAGNRIGIVKSLGNSSIGGRGRTQMYFLRTALFEQLEKDNFKPGTKTKFTVPVQVMYMGIPNIKSDGESKILYNFSSEAGDRNIDPSKIVSVGYATYGKMEFKDGKKFDTPYNYAKNVLNDSTYNGRKVPVVVFKHNGKDVIYPIGLVDTNTVPMKERFQPILDQETNLTHGEFVKNVNDFLSENGAPKHIRLASIGYDNKMAAILNYIETAENLPTIDELMNTGNFRDILTSNAFIDINLNDKPFAGPKVRFDMNSVPAVTSNLLTEQGVSPNSQTVEEILNEQEDTECLD